MTDNSRNQVKPTGEAAEALEVVRVRKAQNLETELGRTTPEPPPDAAPVLVEEGCSGVFNIILCAGRYFALAQDEGAFSLESIRLGRYRRCYEAASIEELKQQLPAVATEPPRDGARAFRAGSSMADDRIEGLQSDRIFLVRFGAELYAIEPDNFRGAFPNWPASSGSDHDTIDLRNTLRVRSVIPRDGVPELIRSIASMNIVRYGGRFYVVPQSCGGIPWGEVDPLDLPGVVEVASAREAVAIAESRLEAPVARPAEETKAAAPVRGQATPHLVKALDHYNIVEYEGWYYGLPHALGPIRLESVDVIELPGVVRDVSADVVEREILEAKP